VTSESKISKGSYVKRRKNPGGTFGLITAILGDYIRISFLGSEPTKVRKKDFGNFYEVVQPPEGYVHAIASKKSTKSKVNKRRTRVRKTVVEDDSDIQVGVIVRVPVRKWGLGVITRINSDGARIVFMDHYTKTISLEVVAQYFIPIEPSRFVPKELTEAKYWSELHSRNQGKFDSRYDPWSVDMFKTT
jgi:hypothetical protein